MSQRRLLMVGNFLSYAKITHSMCEDLCAYFKKAGWPVIATSTKVGRFARLADMTVTAWRRRKHYDIAYVDVFSGPAFLWAEVVCWVLRRARRPYILVLRGGNLPVYAKQWPRRVSRLLNSAQRIVTPSYFLQQAFHAIRPDIIRVANPLEVKRYPFKLRAAPAPNLVWLRAFNEHYRPLVAVETLAHLLPSHPQATLTMLGPDRKDQSRAQTQARAADLNLSDRVRILEGIPKTQVPDELNRHDIFLNTTTVESFGVAVLEAAACGLCVVTTNVGELPYIWSDGQDALLVPPNDPVAMSKAVNRILTEPGLAERLSRNARAKAETFDWTSILTQWEKLFNDEVTSFGL